MTIIASIITLSNPKQSTTGSVSTVSAASKFGSNGISSCGGNSGSGSGLLGGVLGSGKNVLGGLIGGVLGGSPSANIGVSVGGANGSQPSPMNGGGQPSQCGCN
ncbi:hypothetical protein ACTA71_004404 [Dictyostelium dimigraforme]